MWKEVVKFVICFLIALFLLPFIVKVVFGLFLILLCFIGGSILYMLIKCVEVWNRLRQNR